MNSSISFYYDADPRFWMAVAEIIWINILLSGDNAIVIAMACRNLPAKQRVLGITLGTAVAVLMRLGFAGIVSTLMTLPYLKIVGGLALLWIAVRLVVPANAVGEVEAPTARLLQAVKVIAVADLVMSLDNVIAVVAAADGNFALLVFGLGISIPVVVAGAAVIMTMLNRFPVLAWAGAALLGWIAGDVIAADRVIAEYIGVYGPEAQDLLKLSCSLAGGAGTVAVGMFMRARQARYVEGEQLQG